MDEQLYLPNEKALIAFSEFIKTKEYPSNIVVKAADLLLTLNNYSFKRRILLAKDEILCMNLENEKIYLIYTLNDEKFNDLTKI